MFKKGDVIPTGFHALPNVQIDAGKFSAGWGRYWNRQGDWSESYSVSNGDLDFTRPGIEFVEGTEQVATGPVKISLDAFTKDELAALKRMKVISE